MSKPKHSVKSSVESLISRHETHFDKRRQFIEENAHQEMVIALIDSIAVSISEAETRALSMIAENGPFLIRINPRRCSS